MEDILKKEREVDNEGLGEDEEEEEVESSETEPEDGQEDSDEEQEDVQESAKESQGADRETGDIRRSLNSDSFEPKEPSAKERDNSAKEEEKETEEEKVKEKMVKAEKEESEEDGKTWTGRLDKEIKDLENSAIASSRFLSQGLGCGLEGGFRNIENSLKSTSTRIAAYGGGGEGGGDREHSLQTRSTRTSAYSSEGREGGAVEVTPSAPLSDPSETKAGREGARTR